MLFPSDAIMTITNLSLLAWVTGHWRRYVVPWQRLSSNAGAHYAPVPHARQSICNNWCVIGLPGARTCVREGFLIGFICLDVF